MLPAVARRGGAREGLAAEQDAGRRLAAAGQPAAPATPGSGPRPARSCCSWGASWASGRSGPTRAASSGGASSEAGGAGIAQWVRDLNAVMRRRAGAPRRRRPPRRLPMGRGRRRRGVGVQLRAPGPRRPARCWSCSTPRRCRAGTTVSACPVAGPVAGAAQQRRRRVRRQRRGQRRRRPRPRRSRGTGWYQSLNLTLPPLGALFLVPDGPDRRPTRAAHRTGRHGHEFAPLATNFRNHRRPRPGGTAGLAPGLRTSPSYTPGVATYEYRCPTCESHFELRRPMSESSSAATCPDGHPGGGAAAVGVRRRCRRGAGAVAGGRAPVPSGGMPAAARPAPATSGSDSGAWRQVSGGQLGGEVGPRRRRRAPPSPACGTAPAGRARQRSTAARPTRQPRSSTWAYSARTPVA